jgi:hypothetical protein
MLNNKPFEPYPQIPIIHAQINAYLILFACIETIQIANVLIEYLKHP